MARPVCGQPDQWRQSFEERNPASCQSRRYRSAPSWSLIRSQSALGANFRRLRSKLGAPKAITAMAHKLARLIYRMMKFGTEYVEKGIEAYESRYRQQQMKWLAKQAASLNLQLLPASVVTG